LTLKINGKLSDMLFKEIIKWFGKSLSKLRIPSFQHPFDEERCTVSR
jgi:hypothetical protein